jgi:hypothetical protein
MACLHPNASGICDPGVRREKQEDVRTTNRYEMHNQGNPHQKLKECPPKARASSKIFGHAPAMH